jgi:drug/metabolite transporter (DMT)-like permease
VAAVFFACFAGLFLGALNITMRKGLARVPDPEAGAATFTAIAFILVAAACLVSGTSFDLGEVWPFVLIGGFVPGLSQLFAVRAVQAAGASRAGILFGMAPLFSSLIAIGAFGEPLRWPLVAGTLLVVAGGASLASENERPVGYRRYGAVVAVLVAVTFGIRDNVSRSVAGHVTADPLAQATAIMLGAALVLAVNLALRPGALRRARKAFTPFSPSGVVTALGQVALFEALDRGRVTVVAPLSGTGVLWTVVLAALFLGRSELIGRRLVVVALLVVAGGTLVGATH